MAGRIREIDGGRLKTALSAKGYNLTEASEEIDRTVACLSQGIKRGILGEKTIELIERRLGVKYDAYKPIKAEEHTVVITTTEAQLKTIVRMIAQVLNNQQAIFELLKGEQNGEY